MLALALSLVAAADTLVLADLGLHVIGAGVQQTVAKRIALQVDLDSYAPWTQSNNIFGISAEQKGSDLFGVVVRGRAVGYLELAPLGLWLSPFAQAGVGWATRAGTKRTGSVWALGASAGYAWLFGRLQIALGLGAQLHDASIPGGDGPPSFLRWYPTLDATAGLTL
jgi:hypothetical protein